MYISIFVVVCNVPGFPTVCVQVQSHERGDFLNRFEVFEGVDINSLYFQTKRREEFKETLTYR